MRTFSIHSLSAACVVGLCSCADVAIVDSGHRAVLMAPGGEFRLLDEGAADVPTGSVVDDFDLRQQVQGGTFVAVTADGVPIVVGDPVVSFGWVAEELVDADRTLGRERAPAVVAAVVHAAIAQVLSGYRWDELDTARLRQAQARITEIAATQLRPRHIALASVELKGVYPRLPGLAQAVTDTSVWQERMAAAKTGVELARQRAQRLRSEASGIATANAHLAPTLTPAVLADTADQAWQKLLASPNTTVQVSNSSSPILEVSP